jgi:hypothetical protein
MVAPSFAPNAGEFGRTTANEGKQKRLEISRFAA